MDQFQQMKQDFPTMYVRLMRNDSKVRCVAAGPALAVASGVLLDMTNRGELCQPRPEVLNPEFISSEGQYDELVDLSNAFPESFDDLVETSFAAEELHETAAAAAKPKKTDPSNFPM